VFAQTVHKSCAHIGGKASHDFIMFQLQGHIAGCEPTGVSNFRVSPEAQQSLYDRDGGGAPEDGFVKRGVARGSSLGVQESPTLDEKSDAIDTAVHCCQR